ncbi:hypothetical protein N2152v2_008417 [Parachlorella kessleri]
MVTSKTAFDILGALEGQEDVDEAAIGVIPEDGEVRRERELKEKARQEKARLAKQQQQQARQQQQQVDRSGQDPPKLNLPFELIRRTRMCDDWVQSGRCRNGSECVFSHDVREKNANCARVKRYQAEQYEKMGYTAAAARCAAAASHMEGAAHRGPAAAGTPSSAAAASYQPQHPPQGQQQPRGPYWKTRLCFNFNAGYCAAGANCNYAHGPDDLREPSLGARPAMQHASQQAQQPYGAGRVYEPLNGAGPIYGAQAVQDYSYIDSLSGGAPAESGGTRAPWPFSDQRSVEGSGAPAASGPAAGGGGSGGQLGALAALMQEDDDLDEHLAFMCPITQERMRDPVVAADGYSYERHAIEAWLSTRDTSPMTNDMLEDKVLIPNLTLVEAMRVIYGD